MGFKCETQNINYLITGLVKLGFKKLVTIKKIEKKCE